MTGKKCLMIAGSLAVGPGLEDCQPEDYQGEEDDGDPQG